MENIRGDRDGHTLFTLKYVNEDPHYPCTMVAEKYKSACCCYQPTRMMELFAGDFRRVSALQRTAPVRYQVMCFESMGRRRRRHPRVKPDMAIELVPPRFGRVSRRSAA